MVYYLIICRSLTYAQRTAQVLERVGIPGWVQRSPKLTSKRAVVTVCVFQKDGSPTR